MKPTIMLDMDGVICDFITEYRKDTSRDSDEKFFRAVKEKRIFSKLSKLPNADRLLNLLFKDLNVSVEILSSLGTMSNQEVAKAATEQKLEWLKSNGIACKANFVGSWSHKRKYANFHTIMIDDREDVIDSFIKSGGHGILYNDSAWDSMQYSICRLVHSVKRHIDMTTVFI